MKRKLTSAMGALMLLLFVGCGTTSGTRSMKPVERAAVDVPAMFEAPAGMSMNDNSCLNPLTDPRDGTEIRMQYAFTEGVGDYEVPSGRYGVQEGELLRINCRTGEVLGIVRR